MFVATCDLFVWCTPAGPPLNLRGCIFRDYIETLSPLQSISCRAFFRGILSAGSLLCSSCDALYCSSVGLGHWHCAAAPSETLLLASMRHFVPCCRRASSAESSSKIALRSLSFVRLIGADSGRACCVVFASMLLSTALRFVADRERRRTSYSSRGRAHWITHSPARGHKTAYYLRHTGHTAWHSPRVHIAQRLRSHGDMSVSGSTSSNWGHFRGCAGSLTGSEWP